MAGRSRCRGRTRHRRPPCRGRRSSANIGPPESPKQVPELLPGGSGGGGSVNEKQTWLASGIGDVHDDVIASPRRSTPGRRPALAGTASPIEPKPTMSARLPSGGSAMVLMARRSDTGDIRDSVTSPTSLWKNGIKPGLATAPLTQDEAAMLEEDDGPAGLKVPATQCAAVSKVWHPIRVPVQMSPMSKRKRSPTSGYSPTARDAVDDPGREAAAPELEASRAIRSARGRKRRRRGARPPAAERTRRRVVCAPLRARSWLDCPLSRSRSPDKARWPPRRNACTRRRRRPSPTPDR